MRTGYISAQLSRWIFLLILLACGIIIGCQPSGRSDTELRDIDPTSLLEDVRTAVGYDALRTWRSGIVLDGAGSSSGVPSEFHYVLLFDGRFKMECNSSLGYLAAFTGTDGYRSDYTGMVYPLEHWSLEVKSLMAWFLGYNWLNPESPLELSPAGVEVRDGLLGITARMPRGVVEVHFWIDSETLLPEAMSWSIYGDENLLELTDYRSVRGVAYPHHIRLTEDGGRTEIRVAAVSEATEAAVDAVGAVLPRPNDTYFNLEIPAAVPSALTNRGLLVRPNVDGCDDVWFILDTGTSCNVIDDRYAKDLGMKQRGKGRAIGVGGTCDIVFLQGNVLTIGPVAMLGPVFVDGRFSYGNKKVQYEVGGILGFDFLARCVVEIDVASGSVSIYMPGEYTNDSAEWNEIIFATDVPALECAMAGGLSGLFYIDTGYADNVTLHGGFVEQHDLLSGRDLEEVGLEGHGGEVSAYRTEIPWFEFGGRRFEHPSVILACADRGSTADKVTAGTVGGGLLSQFETLILDYPGKRIGFVK